MVRFDTYIAYWRPRLKSQFKVSRFEFAFRECHWCPLIAVGCPAHADETDFEPEPIPVYLLHTGERGPSVKVRSFIDFAVEKLRASRAFIVTQELVSARRS